MYARKSILAAMYSKKKKNVVALFLDQCYSVYYLSMCVTTLYKQKSLQKHFADIMLLKKISFEI